MIDRHALHFPIETYLCRLTARSTGRAGKLLLSRGRRWRRAG